ncbi:GNAT family N-acetyltransferase [Rarobacter incanus]|uniref:L-amino acid N-acyltransferase YncA n=1 Tax=Rarobacter incanus TaxID=153494 RepID=A0A542SRH2_9MICO|nr:GNAT family N-acetyltransferase [Rarobacter incanus]TQK76817.1 L-amino acid N-acyltransferase YncA [Rarobacter incanus]
MVFIREAIVADESGIWGALEPAIRAGETYCFPRDASRTEVLDWWLDKAGGRVLVAVDEDETVLGTAEFHPNQFAQGSMVANAGFAVSPMFSGRGIGRTLGLAVLRQCRADGYTGMQFNAVVSTNHRALALWRSLGFVIVATIPRAFEHPAAGLVPLHVMYRPLS